MSNSVVSMPDYLSHDDIRKNVADALAEDIGSGDLTASLIDKSSMATASVVSREEAILCGTAWVDEVFSQLDSNTTITWQAIDGEVIKPDQIICTLEASAQTLLIGERTALNFLQMLSGTATLARKYADAVKDTRCKILDTRKTIPGLRKAQKYAALCGGCHNHRVGLYDAILIKENHIAAAGSITAAIELARVSTSPGVMIETEVETLDELKEALRAGTDRILLDNMDVDTLRKAVAINNGKAELEASGGMQLEGLHEIADTGVDYISSGSITKHIRAIDLSMRITSIK